jgi:hypothetical protein
MVNPMTTPESEPSITSSFRELLSYINTLGEHVNQIYDRLEKMEADLGKMRDEQTSSLSENKKELEAMRKNTITKTEFNDLLKKLNEPFEKFTPPKTERPRRTRASTTAEQEKK